jgi:hypothetical protein
MFRLRQSNARAKWQWVGEGVAWRGRLTLAGAARYNDLTHETAVASGLRAPGRSVSEFQPRRRLSACTVLKKQSRNFDRMPESLPKMRLCERSENVKEATPRDREEHRHDVC